MFTSVAAISAFLAVPALILAWLYGAYFFKTRRRKYGLLNDIFSAVALLLLIFPTLEINKLATQNPNWFTILSWAAVTGMVLGALGQILLVIGKVSLGTSFITGGIGIVPILAWFVSVTALALYRQILTPLLGWFSLAVLAFVVLIVIVAAFKRKFLIGPFSLLLVLTLSFWLFNLGLFLKG